MLQRPSRNRESSTARPCSFTPSTSFTAGVAGLVAVVAAVAAALAVVSAHWVWPGILVVAALLLLVVVGVLIGIAQKNRTPPEQRRGSL